MITGDYIERKGKRSDGSIGPIRVVTSTTGVEYRIAKKFGAGGVGTVYRAFRVSDGMACVFKEYVPSAELRKVHRNIKNNIKELMRQPLLDDDGSVLKSFVGPLDKDSLIELPASGGFGYIMELVDMNAYKSVPKLRHGDTYPDADVLCTAGYNIAHFFRRVHKRGKCYKDINEGNVYINTRTGDIRVIDCDNISVQSVKVIKGTDGFMAPEVYSTETPDTYTDYYSMAVLLYRMLVGGFPMDGRKTLKYLKDNGLSVQEAASTIYGKMALFAFDPRDTSNNIRNLVDPVEPKLYKCQTFAWDWLSPELQKRFIQTFSDGLASTDRGKRVDDRSWEQTFLKVRSAGIVKCKCRRFNFGHLSETRYCLFCQRQLPRLVPPLPLPPPPPPPGPELSTVIFQAKRDIAPSNFPVEAKRKTALRGAVTHPSLPDAWLRIEYSKARNLLAAVNLTNLTWIVSDNGIKSDCPPHGRVVLKKGLIITVMRRQLQLTVMELK